MLNLQKLHQSLSASIQHQQNSSCTSAAAAAATSMPTTLAGLQGLAAGLSSGGAAAAAAAVVAAAAAAGLNSPLNLSVGSTGGGCSTSNLQSKQHGNCGPVNSNVGGGSGGGGIGVGGLVGGMNNVTGGGGCSQMPQLILASGQLIQGVQGAQLLIPTSQGKYYFL